MAFNRVRKSGTKKGAPTDHEQDLLRAGLLFSTAGLDAMVKQLVQDALPGVLEKQEGALKQFEQFVLRQLQKTNGEEVKLLAKALISQSPRQELMTALIEELTGGSLQSRDQLLKVAGFFAITAKELSVDLDRIAEVFKVRNQIVHEMDVLLNQVNRSRRSRALSTMRNHTDLVLELSCQFYKLVEQRV